VPERLDGVLPAGARRLKLLGEQAGPRSMLGRQPVAQLGDDRRWTVMKGGAEPGDMVLGVLLGVRDQIAEEGARLR
jgi:hypothetical protein